MVHSAGLTALKRPIASAYRMPTPTVLNASIRVSVAVASRGGMAFVPVVMCNECPPDLPSPSPAHPQLVYCENPMTSANLLSLPPDRIGRSEERRVGKECR